jgi:hypothetical protein
MSIEKTKNTERAYILNVAQQFLQSITESYFNPLSNENWFHEICNMNGHDVRSFYANFADRAEKFLTGFKGSSLQRIICASTPGEAPHYSQSPKSVAESMGMADRHYLCSKHSHPWQDQESKRYSHTS